MRRIMLLTTGLTAGLAVAAAPDWTERFAGSPRAEWRISPGLKWQTNGLWFAAAENQWAFVPWDVGTQPFELVWQVDIEKGLPQAWRYPGVALGLSSDPPDQADTNTLSVLMVIHQDGPSAAVRKGIPYAPNLNQTGWPPPRSRMADQELSPRGVLNEAGRGGRFYSIQWPKGSLAGTRLGFRLLRETGNKLVFEMYHFEYEDGTQPWWRGEWLLPSALAAVPLRWLVIKTVTNPAGKGDPLSGWIRHIAARVAQEPVRPVLAFQHLAPGPVPPVARSPARRPGLLFQAKELEDARRKFNEPAFAAYRKLILDNAESALAEGAEKPASRLADLLWAYLFSGEPKYRQPLLAAIQAESAAIDHLEFRLMAAGDMALAYDMFHAELPAAVRLRMEQYLDRVVRRYVAAVKGNDWWHADNPSNTIAVGAGGGGLAGLAVMDRNPQGLEVARLASRMARERYKAIAVDGGCVEGTLYWNYGLTHYLRFAHALRRATGSDDGLLDTPALRANLRFVETQLAGDGRFFTFNDTQPWLTGLAVCADFGSRFHQPLMLWLADHMATRFANRQGIASENARSDVVPYAFLWRSREPAPKEFPGVPLAAKLDTMHWGVLRSDGGFQPGLVLGVKGQGGPLTHHAQPDAGSFVVYARGEMFLLDPGYYQPGASNHTLLLCDGQGPEVVRGTSSPAPLMDLWEQSPYRTLSVDATRAYAKTVARKVRRHFVMREALAVVVLDEVVADGAVSALFQCAAPPEIGGDQRSASLAGKSTRLHVRFFGPLAGLKSSGPRDFGKSWIFQKLAQAGELSWHTLTAVGRADPDQPWLTVLTPTGLHEPAPLVEVTREPSVIVVRINGTEAVTFRQRADMIWEVTRPEAQVRP